MVKSSELRPALSPEEWASIPEEWEPTGDPLTGVGIGYTNGDFPTGRLHNAFPPVQLIALLNHSLPDGHEQKITQDDVDLLREAAQQIRGLMERFKDDLESQPFFDPIAGLSRSQIRLERLATVIASILPPPPPMIPFQVRRASTQP